MTALQYAEYSEACGKSAVVAVLKEHIAQGEQRM
jgi:hypothetical protein